MPIENNALSRYLLPLEQLLEIVITYPEWSVEEIYEHIPKDAEGNAPFSISQVQNVLFRLRLHTVMLRKYQQQSYREQHSTKGFFYQENIQRLLPKILVYLHHSNIHQQTIKPTVPVYSQSEKDGNIPAESSQNFSIPAPVVVQPVNVQPVITENEKPITIPVPVMSVIPIPAKQEEIIRQDDTHLTEAKVESQLKTEPVLPVIHETMIADVQKNQQSADIRKDQIEVQRKSYSVISEKRNKIKLTNLFSTKLVLFLFTVIFLLYFLVTVFSGKFLNNQPSKQIDDLSLPVSSETK